MNCDISEQYLNKTYEDLNKEQMRLMNDLKSNSGENEESSKEVDIQKQLTLLNSLMREVLKLRNLRKKIILKGHNV